ncbi:DUF2742 domain-containing protein [Tsukamurella tyrosinosolvens]|uniref:DUF2742 domain-containing protein n=1 Tax=Tsukamurella tyrosinosolvens TaxID=57704 RepID=UPI003F4A58D4
MTADAAIAARTWAQEAGIWLPAPAGHPSREVSFSVGLEWAAPFLTAHTGLPTFGTPAWRDETDQRRKTASAVVAALDWAMRLEVVAETTTEASHAIADALDWREESKHTSYRTSGSYIPRRAHHDLAR